MFTLPWFNKKSNTPVAILNQKPAVDDHDITLVPSLIQEHRKLLRIVDEMSRNLSENQFGFLDENMRAFKIALSEHLLTENVRFYGYLESKFPPNSTNSKILSEFRIEMDGIAEVVIAFIKKYHETPMEPSRSQDFTHDLSVISGALMDRIQREERTLYPLYKQVGV